MVLKFVTSTPQELAALEQAVDDFSLDVWESTKDWTHIRISKDDLPTLLGSLPESLQEAYSTVMPDLAEAIYNTYPVESSKKSTLSEFRSKFLNKKVQLSSEDNIFFNEYQPLSVIEPWMRLMASMFTGHVSMLNIGKSYQGRDISALRIGAPTEHDQKGLPTGRKTIIINGGSHAREWISTASVAYIAWSLITQYEKQDLVTKMIREFDWIIIPTLNPDGYVHSWENDRLWRKNMQQTSLRYCKGIDLDRSFGFQWDGTNYQSNPCSESYPGDEPFQANESKALADWAMKEEKENNKTFVGFLDMHSYSQQVLYPYSFSCDVAPPTIENLEELGIGLAKNIHLDSGERYTVESACEGDVGMDQSSKKEKNVKKLKVESAAGSALDWFYHELKVRYAYQLKLRDTGSYGFLLPSEDIVPVGREAFAAVKYFADFLSGNKGIERGVRTEESGSVHEDIKAWNKAAHEERASKQGGEHAEQTEGDEQRGWLSSSFELRRRR